MDPLEELVNEPDARDQAVRAAVTIPPPPEPLNPVAQMDYETRYAAEHGLPPPQYNPDQIAAYREQRGYTSPVNAIEENDPDRIAARAQAEKDAALKAQQEADAQSRREQELRQASNYAAEVAAGKERLPDDVNRNEFNQSARDVQAKVDLIDRYRGAGKDISRQESREAYAMIYGKAAPFVNLATNQVDIFGAIKAGVGDVDLKAAGIKQEDIDSAHFQIKDIANARTTLDEIFQNEYGMPYKQVLAARDDVLIALRGYTVKDPADNKDKIDFAAAFRDGKGNLVTKGAQLGLWTLSTPGKPETLAAQEAASAKLEEAGFAVDYSRRLADAQEKLRNRDPSARSEIDSVLKRYTSVPESQRFNVPNLAKYVRNHPEDGVSTVRDYYGDDAEKMLTAINDYNSHANEIIKYLDQGVLLKGAEGSGQGRNLSPYEFTALERALGNAGLKLSEQDRGLWENAWQRADPDTKVEAAIAFDRDYLKSNFLSSLSERVQMISEAGTAGRLLVGNIEPITTPFGKQSSLNEAKAQMSKEYRAELKALSGYVQNDGRFDTGRLSNDMKDPETSKAILKETGYDSASDLKQSLEYFNSATRVSREEWATAGLVGAMNILAFGGSELIPGVAGQLAGGLGKVTRLTGRAAVTVPLAGRVAQGLAKATTLAGSAADLAPLAVRAADVAAPIALGVVQAKPTIEALKSPDVSVGEKAMAVGSELALIGLPLLGPAIRGAEFLKVVNSDGYVPLRNMAIEKSTSRVPFNDAQLANMRKAGATESDIIKFGTDINKQLVSGAKEATIKFGDVAVTVPNTPYLQSQTLSVFHATPDITVFERGGNIPLIKKLYTAAKVAIDPLERSYITGQAATTPGIVEVKISDPDIISDIMPQEKLINGNRVLELEAPIPSMEELRGKGYMLKPIPGPDGRGVSYHAPLGTLQIRRFELVKIGDNSSGLRTVRFVDNAWRADGVGTVAVGDPHATSNFEGFYHDVNQQFKEPVLKGDPSNPRTWHATGTKANVVILGDTVDRGADSVYDLWRETANRLDDEFKQTNGTRFVRLAGNHDLAYMSGDRIKGIVSNDARDAAIKAGDVADVKAGHMPAAFADNGKLYTHAGVSKKVFAEYQGGTTAKSVADDLNRQFIKAVDNDNYSGKMFAKGRVEKGNSLSYNERAQGGNFWLRPQEATEAELDLGFPQVVGHNPGADVRRIWGPNFIEADVSRRTGGRGVYADTPFARTEAVPIVTESLGPIKPQIRGAALAMLSLKAMRDTVADMVVGWDGRIKAIDALKYNKNAVKALVNDFDKQIAERAKAGDSIGVDFLNRQKSELLSPTGKDYLYGGIEFWRDIAMGRQNSVKVRDNISKASMDDLKSARKTIGDVKGRIEQMPERDVRDLFGREKKTVLDDLNASRMSEADIAAARKLIGDRANKLVRIVDDGLDRYAGQFLDRAVLSERYQRVLDTRLKLQAAIGPQATRPMAAADGREETPAGGEDIPAVPPPGDEQPVRTYEPTEERYPVSPSTRPPAGESRTGPPEPERRDRMTNRRAPGYEVGAPPQRGEAPARETPGSRAVRAAEIAREPGRGTLESSRQPIQTPSTQPPGRVPPPRVPTPVPEPFVPRQPFAPRGLSNEQKRYMIRNNRDGAVGWSQGELKIDGKLQNVYHIILAPYDGPPRHFTVQGAAPEGAEIFDGPGEAYKSMKVLRGKGPEQPLVIDQGAVKATISPSRGNKGVQIGFSRDFSIRHAKIPKTTTKDLGAGIVETRGRRGVRRHIRLS